MTPTAPGLETLTSPDLGPVRHGFFTRKGGASGGIYGSQTGGLNAGAGSKDDAAAVAENKARIAAAMGVAPDRLLFLHQVHSDRALHVTGPWAEDADRRADAMVTAEPGLALAVLSADCAPVLFHDPDARVIGAAHAGWRGALGGALEATLEAMERLGAERGRIRAAIGPCISQAAYEVGPEFFDDFTMDDPEAQRFFAGGPNGRPMFDLPGYALRRLREAGVAEAAWTGHCTYRDEARFYSNRRAVHRKEGDYGRLASVIVLED
ncbi:peptidoglycan editing factor PgeF [Albimonas sp. CAU 1670]|uniref:peptidoglycan editing factor PgeF n=1 Tax=Albimonas sp. CAU 1670 TaxID=3032599 RepID=UPI0023DC7634|nr:peptidoglycan editing factor PgeF [Albimonas sp. CAU 1670]MDF2234919.1 peptidoglycan editing factor PgeF [Albimonas sp. CAU 1670]